MLNGYYITALQSAQCSVSYLVLCSGFWGVCSSFFYFVSSNSFIIIINEINLLWSFCPEVYEAQIASQTFYVCEKNKILSQDIKAFISIEHFTANTVQLRLLPKLITGLITLHTYILFIFKWGSTILPACNSPPVLFSPVLQKQSGLELTPVSLPMYPTWWKSEQAAQPCRGRPMPSFPTMLVSSKQHLQEKQEGQRNTAQRHGLSHCICITSNRVFSSQTKQPSQSLLLQTEHTLNKGCFTALLYSKRHKQSNVCLAGFCLGEGLWSFHFVLILIRNTGLGGTQKEISRSLCFGGFYSPHEPCVMTIPVYNQATVLCSRCWQVRIWLP